MGIYVLLSAASAGFDLVCLIRIPGIHHDKSDRLAGTEHLERWVNLIETNGRALAVEFDRKNILNDLNTSVRVTNWAYRQTQEAGGLTWQKGNQLQPMTAGWENLLAELN